MRQEPDEIDTCIVVDICRTVVLTPRSRQILRHEVDEMRLRARMEGRAHATSSTIGADVALGEKQAENFPQLVREFDTAGT